MVRQDDFKRILIVKLSSIGDVVMTTPVAKALRQAYPKAHIAWVVESKSKEAVIGNPYLDEVIVWNRHAVKNGGLRKTAAFAANLAELSVKFREPRYDLVIDLQGLLRSALVTHVSRARVRLGYEGSREGARHFYNLRLPRAEDTDKGTQQYLNLLRPLGIITSDRDMLMPLDDEDRAFARKFIADVLPGFSTPRRVVALCPATTWPQKHWTEDGWASLADRLVSEYGSMPIFLGSKADVPMVERICGMMTHEAAVATGKMTLKQSAALCGESDLVITVDTGLLHISMAIGRPVVGLFGPTSWQQFMNKNKLAVVVKDFPCMPCMRHPSCGDYHCMTAITADDVLEISEPWLKNISRE